MMILQVGSSERTLCVYLPLAHLHLLVAGAHYQIKVLQLLLFCFSDDDDVTKMKCAIS